MRSNKANVLESDKIISYNREKGGAMDLDKESLIHLICGHCDFYKESDKDLECGAFKILKGLLKKGKLTPEEIIDALRE